MRVLDPLLWALLAVGGATSGFVALELVWGPVNVPVADVAALLVAVAFGLRLLLTPASRPFVGSLRATPAGLSATAALAFPAPVWFALFAGGAAVAWLQGPWCGDCAYEFLRKPVFTWVVYGGAVASAVAFLGNPGRLHWVALVTTVCLALPCLYVALPLLLAGWASGVDTVGPLATNHKALAVALAPWLPFVLAGRSLGGRARAVLSWVLLALGVFAVAASFSRTAWLAGAVGLLALLPVAGKPLLARPAWALVATVALAALVVATPFVLANAVMTDAFDSRLSLSWRAWLLFADHPLFGSGPGASTRYLFDEAPDWRINGVDAHGVLQKLLGEYGLFGLLTYGSLIAFLLRGLWSAAFGRDSRGGALHAGVAATGVALFANLLFSTETFTSSHWFPLAIAIGLARGAGAQGTRSG